MQSKQQTKKKSSTMKTDREIEIELNSKGKKEKGRKIVKCTI